jgi:hypothetical protein
VSVAVVITAKAKIILVVTAEYTVSGRETWCWLHYKTSKKQAPWLESSELYRRSDRRLSPKLVSTFVDIGVSRSGRGGSPTTVILVF